MTTTLLENSKLLWGVSGKDVHSEREMSTRSHDRITDGASWDEVISDRKPFWLRIGKENI